MRNIFIIIAIIVIGGGMFYFSNNDAVEVQDTSVISNPNELNDKYLDYSPDLLYRADTGNVVLNFHATWCSTCKILDKNLKNNLDKFPENLTILKLNYDRETDLKKKYGVFIQHTLVQVDSNGNEITKWTGGNDLDSILRRLK